MTLRASLLASASVLALTNVVSAGPQGGSVVSGAAVIATPNAQTLNVTQSTANAIIDWRSFSIGTGESANFTTPTGGATLNRVTGTDPSAIYGTLTSTGRLILLNQNGIVVGPSGVIDTAGLILSTHSVKDAEFLAGGDMTFSGTSGASVINNGAIRSTGGGDVFLIARYVENNGKISAPGGAVGLAGGSEILLRASDVGDGRIAVRAGPGAVKNAGAIAAVTAELRAAGGNHYALAVNNTGVVRATGVATRGGRVFLTANSGKISSSGTVSARNANGSGGKVRIAAAPRPAAAPVRRPAARQNVVDISGALDVSGANGAGGSLIITGEAVSLASSARLDASGSTGGGFIAIGGGFQGKDATILNADDVQVASGAQIVADATAKGDGGKVSIWADGATTFHGAISARGGAAGGNGGFAEVSGKESVTVSGHADMRAPLGAFGTFLIDPGSITIQDGLDAAVDANTFNDAYIEAQLGLSNFTIQTATATGGGAEDITVKNGVSIVWNGATLLSLRAGADIIVENNVVISNTQTGDGTNTFVSKDVGGVELLAGADITIGAVANAGAIRIGSEFGVTRLVAGDANFNRAPDAPGTGKIDLIGGGADGSHVQIGYRQPLLRGNNTGADYSSPSTHAENGTISVLAGGDVTLTGGSMKGSFVQVGHGGLTTGSTAEILRSNVHVISSGGSVKLGALGVESAFAKIGHGSYFEVANGVGYALGRISGDIHVNALTSVTLNASATPDADKVAENGVADIFMARIGHGAHLQAESDSLDIATGDMAGAITIGAKSGALLTPATPLLLVQLGSAISPLAIEDSRQVSSQIGHGSDVRMMLATDAGGAASVNLGGVRPFIDINGFITAAADVTVKADEIALNSIIAAPLNGLNNMQRASIGAGNYVRMEPGAAKAFAVVDTSVTVSGVDLSVDGLTLAEALATDLSLLSAEARGKLANLAAANTKTQAQATPFVTSTPFDVSLLENDLTGNILVSTTAGTGKGISLLSSITAGDIAVLGHMALTRIGHNSFIQLATPQGAAGQALPLSLAAPARGGNITFTEANVLYSTIRVETNNDDDVTATASVTAGLGAVLFNNLSASIGSGSEVMLMTGSGGTGVGEANVAALSGARGGDVHYRRGTVWDGNYTSAATSTGDDGYDTTIVIASANNINVATSATAGLAAASENIVLGRVGHGATIAIYSGEGGAAGTLGANGGRGGDIRVEQQTPGRDYGVNGGADDFAWGLRGQIDLQASDLTAIPAVSITSAATAALAAAANNSISSRVGHGDQMSVTSGAGASGGSRLQDSLVTTAHGGRGGHIDVDFSKRLIESSIIGRIEGELKLDAQTVNALAPSTKNLSEAVMGHGDSIQALSGSGGAGGLGASLTNRVTIAQGQATADAFFSNGVFSAANGVGAARGGNGGDISIAFGAIAERTGSAGSGFIHDGESNIDLTLTGANATHRSLTVNSLIAPGLANGPGDQVTANIGHNARFVAVGGAGGLGGIGSASMDRGFINAQPLDATTPRPIQNDASGGRGGDVRIIAGNHNADGLAGAPADTLVIGRVIINADEQVSVTSTAGPGSFSRAHSGIGHLFDMVAITDAGGGSFGMIGANGFDYTSGDNDGIANSAQTIQVIVNRDGSRGVSLSGSGNADTIQSVAARRTASPVNGSTANPSFFDVSGNPEFILDASGALVANSDGNSALRSSEANIARFGRTVGAYDPGVSNMERVQYVDINNDGRPDVVAAVLSSASLLTLVDADNNNVYDQIAGRVRLADGDLAALGLVDYVYATGRTASASGNRLDWTHADFSTANGGRGGDSSITTGLTRTRELAPLVTLNAGIVNSGAPAASPDFSLVVNSTAMATPLSAGPNNTAAARIGVSDYIYAATDGSYDSRLAGAHHSGVAASANGGAAGVNAVNANGGRGGAASVNAGGVIGDIAINMQAPLTRGVQVSAFTEDVTSGNRSIAAIGHGGQYFARAVNVGGAGQSDPTNGSFITESANGGAGGAASVTIAERTGDVTVRAGSAEAGGDFALVIEATKGGSPVIGDSDDITFANVGHGGLVAVASGTGGTANDGQYLASGGAGGAATINVAATSGAVTLDSFTYADAAFGNGVRIESSTSEGDAQKVRAQAGHYSFMTSEAGAGGSGTVESEIVEQFNQQANGGAGGVASITHAGFIGDVSIDAGPAKSGDDAIIIKSSENTIFSLANNYLLATAGHGAFANAQGGAGGQSGQRDALGGLTLSADPAFHQGFDVAAVNASATAPLDLNPIMLGTIRNGGAGGNGLIAIGETSGAINVRAHDLSAAAGKDGILVTALVGDGANIGSSLFGNVAMIGHNHNASATGAAGGSSISSTLGATVSRGDGGDGGAGRISFAAITGDVSVTNVVAGEANLTRAAMDKDIKVIASDQDATDSAAHRATARIGHRTMADTFGGAGGNAALPPPGPMYNATISAQGGFGGEARIDSGLVSGAISIIAENSVVLSALNPTVSSPTVVAGIGHHSIANSAIAGAGGFGGMSASFNDHAMLNALRRYVDLGQNYSALSEMEKLLVAPVLDYYKVSPVYSGQAGPATVLPASFIARVLAGPPAYIAGTIAAYPLARDNDAIAGTSNAIPTVSAEERAALIALANASGHGGRAFVSQAGVSGDVEILAVSSNAADAARGVAISTLGVLNAGTQIAHVGHELEVALATGGKGQNLRAGTNADGIGGDGGAVSISQGAIAAAISLTAGATTQATTGAISVIASGSLTGGWQRSLIGHRATLGNDDPGFRSAPVVRAGDGGGDQDALATGKLGNGGSVTIDQAGASGAIGLTAIGTVADENAVFVSSSADLATGETLASIGHALIVDSVKAGDAIPYIVGPDARASLYGVREGNGGSIAISQGAVSDAITLDASGNLAVVSATALAPGRATTIIGHKQVIADNVYGARSGSVVAGNGADVLSTEDIDVANGAPGFTNTIHATPVQDADGGNVIIAQAAMAADITLRSRNENVDVLADGVTGTAQTDIGHQRFTTASTGEGGTLIGPAPPRAPGEGGAAIISRGEVSGDILIEAMAAGKTATVKTTSALGSVANALVGHTVNFNIATGRSGYGSAAFATLDAALAAYLALPAPTAGAGTDGEATSRDAARIIQQLENVVAAITFANRYSEHYSAAQQADLALALTNATAALATARAASLANVAAAVTSAKTALALANATVIAGGNPNGIANGADSGAIVYATDGGVAGDILVRAGVPVLTGPYLAGGIVAIQAENGDGAASLVELGHRYAITNSTGIGAGLTTGGSLDGGVAGDSGRIVTSQTTSGDVSLIADRVVVNPTSGIGAADVHLLHKVAMTNVTGKADIEGLLGRGGSITATQTSSGIAAIRANELSSATTGAADGLLMADGGPAASNLRIGIEASAIHWSGSDSMIAGLGGPDNNRGGTIAATQSVASGFNLNLDLNASGNRADLIIRAVGLSEKKVRIGALVTQTATSGDPVDDGSNVSASQTVSGDVVTSGLEDIVVENNGPDASTIRIGHTAAQVADSGETSGLTTQHGGITTAVQDVSGSISLASSRSFTQQTSAEVAGLNHIGHDGAQTARSANQRTALTPADYPIVAGAPSAKFNVASTQSVRADLTVTTGEILIQSLNGLAEGVRLGNKAAITLDTHADGRVKSVSTLGGNLGLTTIAALAQQDATVSSAVAGDIRILVPAKGGEAQVGHSSTSKVSHDPAAFQPTGVFSTQQNIVDAINVTSLRNVEVRNGEAGVARLGHTIVEAGALSTTDAVKTSTLDPSTVAQKIDSAIAVTAGNSLGMVTVDGGIAQIGHFSPASNQWQVTGDRVVTPQIIDGFVTVKVGLNANPTIVGQAPAAGALGTNNALLDGTAGGEVRIGHKFAPVSGAAANEVQTAAGDVWVEVGAHLHVKTANIGHGPYDFAASAVSKDTAVRGAGTVRNRIAGLTTIGAGQNTPSPQDATTEPDILLFSGANVNSGYGENGGELRFFIPSRQNLTIVEAGPEVAVTQFNDSTSKTDAIAPRTASDELIVGAVTHENGFTQMSTTALYQDIGVGNFAFYFGSPDANAAIPYVASPWDFLHRVEGAGASCVASSEGGVNAGAATQRPRRALGWASAWTLPGTDADGEDCGASPASERARENFSFIPAGSGARGNAQAAPALQAPVVSAGRQDEIIIRTAQPAPVILAPVQDRSAQAVTSVPLQAVRVSGDRVLSFATSGTNLIATISRR